MFLTDAEIADLCEPLTQPAAQVRYLRSLGLAVTTKPNGRPVVVRSHVESVLSGRNQQAPAQAAPLMQPQQPNRDAFIQLVRGKHGTTPKTQSA